MSRRRALTEIGCATRRSFAYHGLVPRPREGTLRGVVASCRRAWLTMSLGEQQSAQTLVFNPEPVLKFECAIDQVWARNGFARPRCDDEQVFGGVFCPDKFLNPGLITPGLQVKAAQGIGDGFSHPIHLNTMPE
jgi:hypothetical protein